MSGRASDGLCGDVFHRGRPLVETSKKKAQGGFPVDTPPEPKNRPFELMYFPDTEKSEETYSQREAHGAHVKYNGKIYIVPMCASENTSLKDEEKEIILKAGTVLVEEVDPIIDKE